MHPCSFLQLQSESRCMEFGSIIPGCAQVPRAFLARRNRLIPESILPAQLFSNN